MSRPTTLPGPWAQLAQAAGGVGALARLLGVSRRTIERWGAGVLPGAIVQEHVPVASVKLCISEGGGGPMDDSPKTASISITKTAWRNLIAKVQYLLLDEGD